MTDDLSDWTEPPDPLKDGFAAALGGGTAAAVSGLTNAVPLAGPLISKAIDSAIAYRHEKWLREGFARVASRLRKLEEAGGPSIEEMLESDEFVAACAAVEQDLRRTASEEKRRRLADALTRMGPWGPYDEDERATLFFLVERYSDLHVQLLQFYADPPGWTTAQEPNDFAETMHAGAIRQLLTSYGHRGDDRWLLRASNVTGELGRDGLIDGGSDLLHTVGSRNALLAKRSTELGDHLLDLVAQPLEAN